MKEMIKASFISLFFMMALSCATTPHTLPEKYNLGNYLEEINQISISKVEYCENIDNQSVLLKANRDAYFLLVLSRPIDKKYGKGPIFVVGFENKASENRDFSTQSIISPDETDFIQAPTKIASIKAGHDRIVLNGDSYKLYYVIAKIYRLNGKRQAEEVKEWLRRFIPVPESRPEKMVLITPHNIYVGMG